MFASPYANRQSAAYAGRQPGGMYRQVAVETQVCGATPHALVLMLFDGYLEAVAQARGAMREGRIEIKGQAVGRAVRILEEGLRAGLNLQSGGTLAADLDDLYTYLTRRLTLANVRNDEAALDECQHLVQPLREAWLSIAPQANSAEL